MSFGNIYNVDVTDAFSGDALPTIQSAIKAFYVNGDQPVIDSVHYAKVVKCDMRGAAQFSVSFNRENNMTAVLLPSGEYGVTYMGGIDRIEFAESTTLTWLQVEWAQAAIV